MNNITPDMCPMCIADVRHNRNHDPALDGLHGRVSTYRVRKCSCTPCRRSSRMYDKDYRLRVGGDHVKARLGIEKPLSVPMFQAARRLQALHCIGYTPHQMSEHTGLAVDTLRRYRRCGAPSLYLDSFKRIDKMYRELRRKPVQEPNEDQKRWMRKAARMDWASPDRWDDNIDLRNGRPSKEVGIK